MSGGTTPLTILVDRQGVLSSESPIPVVAAALPGAQITPTGGIGGAVPDVLAFLGRTHQTQELSGPPSDLPVGYHRIVWNTATNRPSCWMNRAGTIIDAFDPNSYSS
jgi:hypothetical protein